MEGRASEGYTQCQCRKHPNSYIKSSRRVAQYRSFQACMCFAIAERGRERPTSRIPTPPLLAWNRTRSINKSRRSADWVPEREHCRRIEKEGKGWLKFWGECLGSEKGWGRRVARGRMFTLRPHPGLDHSYFLQQMIQKEKEQRGDICVLLLVWKGAMDMLT